MVKFGGLIVVGKRETMPASIIKAELSGRGVGFAFAWSVFMALFTFGD
jgi:hypothetical protein